ncbi:hypothetical protein LB505_011279 [Fusarium chuoi]|nr:hypothetical protein LB503_000965 [Fusarium chuoi]KAI1044660.1 hypothetical protein LB505_011279 [Fusarium chuoi]
MKDPTIAVRPVHPPSFGSPKDLSSVQENAINAFLANTESPKSTQDNFAPAAYPRPTYAVLETPLADPTNARPNAALNRPRKLDDCIVLSISRKHGFSKTDPFLGQQNEYGNGRIDFSMAT